MINQGYIHRSNIYYPLLNTEKYRKSGTWDSGAYLLEESGTLLTDPTTFPDRDYIISKIQEVLRYTNQNPGIKILDGLGRDISIEELAERYYNNPEQYFTREEEKS